MTLYWLETIKLEPGTEEAYLDAMQHRLYPLLATLPDTLRTPCGLFKIDANNAEWPTMFAIWAYADWSAYVESRKPETATSDVRRAPALQRTVPVEPRRREVAAFSLLLDSGAVAVQP